MKKVLAILVVLILPIGSYLIVSRYSREAVVMPKRYFFDTVRTVKVGGKKKKDEGGKNGAGDSPSRNRERAMEEDLEHKGRERADRGQC